MALDDEIITHETGFLESVDLCFGVFIFYCILSTISWLPGAITRDSDDMNGFPTPDNPPDHGWYTPSDMIVTISTLSYHAHV